MSQSVTLQLPEDAWERYRRSAEAAGKDLEVFLAERLIDAVPPLGDDLPAEVRQELTALEKLEDDALTRLAERQFPQRKQRQYERLLAKQVEGSITSDERQTLHTLGEEIRRLMLKKAHAFMLLKWRGRSIPSRDQLHSAG